MIDRLVMIALTLALSGAAGAAQDARPDPMPPPPTGAAADQGLLAKPFPRAHDPAVFVRWWRDARIEAMTRLRTARTAKDAAAVSRIVALIEDMKVHAFRELERLRAKAKEATPTPPPPAVGTD